MIELLDALIFFHSIVKWLITIGILAYSIKDILNLPIDGFYLWDSWEHYKRDYF